VTTAGNDRRAQWGGAWVDSDGDGVHEFDLLKSNSSCIFYFDEVNYRIGKKLAFLH
jgi:hypothetical protein